LAGLIVSLTHGFQWCAQNQHRHECPNGNEVAKTHKNLACRPHRLQGLTSSLHLKILGLEDNKNTRM